VPTETAAPPETVTYAQLLCEVEALLFVTAEPLSIPRLVALTGVDPGTVGASLAELEERYAGRGITIRSVGGGYRFATAPRARTAVEALLLPPKHSLSPAALETLAVVAYSQPVTKAEIEAVRGVSVDGIVNSLVEKGFLAEAGQKETLGRPTLFATTQEFLVAFGLPSLEALPPLPSPAGKPGTTERSPLSQP
jgi:segregation and condensation protein B